MASRRTSFGSYRDPGGHMTVMVEGYDELQAVLSKMLRDTEDLRPAWPLYHEAFKKAEGEWFISQGAGTWAPLRARYAEWKARHGYTRRPLIMTRRLIQSLGNENGDHIYDVDPRWMRTGTRDPVGNIHFSRKRRSKRRPIDANSGTMQNHMREAVVKHAEMYGETWGGGRG